MLTNVLETVLVCGYLRSSDFETPVFSPWSYCIWWFLTLAGAERAQP